MAIQINNTTVIDDSRNIQNIGVATATTFVGNVVGNINSSGVSTFTSLRTTNINATGVTTSTGGFVGALTGNATGLSGTPNITVGTIGATSLNATGFVTATEYDITGSTNTFNSSGLSVGVITATTLVVGSAVTITTNGLNTVGVITANDYDGNFILDSYLFN